MSVGGEQRFMFWFELVCLWCGKSEGCSVSPSLVSRKVREKLAVHWCEIQKVLRACSKARAALFVELFEGNFTCNCL